jgi:CrcB protein
VTVLAVAVGAALGAPARYLLDRRVQGWHRSVFPWGLVVVNLLGSLVLGLITGVASGREVPAALLAGLATGWCGAFTTYSSFGYETVELARGRRAGLALVNVLITVVGGVAAVATGFAAGRFLAGG